MTASPTRRQTKYGERQARISNGEVKPMCGRGYGFDTGGLGQPDPSCDCAACRSYFSGAVVSR